MSQLIYKNYMHTYAGYGMLLLGHRAVYMCIGYKNIPVNLGGAPKAIQISGT